MVPANTIITSTSYNLLYLYAGGLLIYYLLIVLNININCNYTIYKYYTLY